MDEGKRVAKHGEREQCSGLDPTALVEGDLVSQEMDGIASASLVAVDALHENKPRYSKMVCQQAG